MKKDPWMVKILKYLYHEGMCHTADVARGVHIATTTAHKYLERMVEDGLVTTRRMGEGKPVFWEVVGTNLKRIQKTIAKEK